MTAQDNKYNSSRAARLTGVAYLGIVFSGIFAEFFVRMSLVHPGDAAKTAENIARSAGLFRMGLAADALMIALDVAVAIGFYVLLRHVHRPLALVGAALRLVQASVLGANLMNMAGALAWATGGPIGAKTPLATTQALTLSFMDLHRVVYDLGLVFFGLSCLVVGELLRKSRLLPPVLGMGLSLSGAVYLIGSFTMILAPELSASLDPMYGLTVIAELSVAAYLTFRGARQEEDASTSVRNKALLASALLLTSAGCGSPERKPTSEEDSPHGTQTSADSDLSLEDYGERGQYRVGYRRLEEEGDGLAVSVWYPTRDVEGQLDYEVTFQGDYYGAPTGRILGQASVDASVVESDSPLPLVVFSQRSFRHREWMYRALCTKPPGDPKEGGLGVSLFRKPLAITVRDESRCRGAWAEGVLHW